jgi:transposase-like protein
MFSLGLSTRRVEDFFMRFFGERAFSCQTVSEVVGKVDMELKEYDKRPLSDKVRYLYLDGFSVTIRKAFKRKQVILVAMAEYEDGHRELIGFQVATSEKGIHWLGLLNDLYRRGLTGKNLKLVVVDGAGGLIEAVRTVYGFVPIQVCWIHRQRNLVRRLKNRSHRKDICADIKAVFHASSREEAIRKLKHFKGNWLPLEPRAVKIFLTDIDLSLTFFDQPSSKWRKLASNNHIERQMHEFRRRVRLIDSFRDDHSCRRIIFTQVQLLNLKLGLNPCS